MNKHCISTSHSRFVHTSLLPSSVRDSAVSSDCSDNPHEQENLINDQQQIYKTCHRHSPTYRNNHNSSLIQHDEVSGATHQKRRPTKPYHQHQSHRKSSFFSIYINNTLLILIRLMILSIIGFTFYHAILYIYPKPKKNEWKRAWYSIIDWLIGE